MNEIRIEDIGAIIGGSISYKGKRGPLISPVTGKEWGKIYKSSPEEVAEAIKVTEKHPTIDMSPTPEPKSSKNISKDLILEKEEITKCIVSEMGKPIQDARSEVTYASNYFKWYAEEVKRVYGKTIPSSKGEKKLEVRYEPIGPCAVITPWNFPIAMAARKIAPAFAAGCPVILKPSSFSPASLMMMVSICFKGGFPDHALQALIGDGKDIVPPLMESQAIRKFSFTGSTKTGIDLYTQGAKTLKRCSLELGGNAPFIIFEDANLEEAAQGAVDAKFRISGQTCICPNRVLVHEEILLPFLKLFLDKVSQLVAGDPFEEETELSTFLHPDSLRKSEEHVKDALAKGAQAHLRRKEPHLPEILTGVNSEMRVFNEETFGPVAPIISFKDEEEAIKLANHTPFGLAAYVYTEGLKRSERVINALEYGIIGLNDPLPSSPEASFGGIKSSGFGREGGPSGIYEYLQEKFVSQKL